ncbi:hypothetical protein [Pseudomonas phage vB_Pa-PAC7]
MTAGTAGETAGLFDRGPNRPAHIEPKEPHHGQDR